MNATQPSQEFFEGKSVVVTGGSGFLGSHVVDRLAGLGVEAFVPRSDEFDLVTEEAVRRLYEAADPDIVIHLAARVGGIGANLENPGAFFYDNMMMGALLMEHARRNDTSKFVQLGTICSYPKFAAIPFREDDLWDGYPEETNAPYGIAKKALLAQAQGYRQQYGSDYIFLMPVNLYGPRDNFDPASSHVIPAMIRKFEEAVEFGATSVELWGDGTPSREFLYVDDAARGILLATERYDDQDPVNLGAGFEITIKDLATQISEIVGFDGELVWDTSKPGGQPRRMLDTTRAKERFGFEAEVQFDAGLRQTVDWFREHRDWIEQDAQQRDAASARADARG
ncbi:MAG: GDP-L-fucose synthase family protein [Solirubrobacterales bacterium]